MTVMSRTIATASPNPVCWSSSTSATTSEPNTAIMMSPAMVICGATAAIARRTASRLSPQRRYSSRTRCTMKTS